MRCKTILTRGLTLVFVMICQSAMGGQAPGAKSAYDEKAVANFYSGKTVRIVVGLTPGGFYDRWARMRAAGSPM